MPLNSKQTNKHTRKFTAFYPHITNILHIT